MYNPNSIKTSDEKSNPANVKPQHLDPPPSSGSFSDIITRFVMSSPISRSTVVIENNNETINVTNFKEQEEAPSRALEKVFESYKERAKSMSNEFDTMNIMLKQNDQLQFKPQPPISTTQTPQTNWPKRACRPPPLPKRFGQQCHCAPSHHNKFFTTNNNTEGALPAVAYSSPLHLYDPISKKCLPTSRNRDMLLKECHINNSYYNPTLYNHETLYQRISIGNTTKGTCYYDDLVCDLRRNRCVCKPSLHLFYENNLSSFGCVPIGPQSSPDGRIVCKPGSMYNMITKDCHKIFDVNDLQSGVSATEFSFVTIIFIWILLLILIVFAKLRKLRTSNLYRNTPQSERRLHHGSSNSNGNSSGLGYRSNRLVWVYPFPSGRHHQRRTPGISRSVIVDESGNYNDTDFFLANGGNRRINDMISDNNFTASQQSLNNENPPKFEEIYPSCTPVPPTVDVTDNVRSQSVQDLPSYDEAIKLQNSMPPDFSKE